MKNIPLYLLSLLIICNFNKVKSNEFNFFADFSYGFGLSDNDEALDNSGVTGVTADTIMHEAFDTIGGSIGASYYDFFLRIGYESSNGLDSSGTITTANGTTTIQEATLDLTNWSFNFGKFFNINESFRVYPQAGIGIASIDVPQILSTTNAVAARGSESENVSWSLGIGGDYKIFENFSTFVEYNYSDYGQAALLEPNNENRFDSEEIKNHAVKLGVRYNF